MKNRRIITVSPITRSSGQLSVQVAVSEGRVVNARVMGGVYRGFEKILVGRHPADAPYLTEKVCGICSTAHSMVASIMLDTVYAVEVPDNGWLLRNLMLGAEFLQNNLRHFYFFELPDYIMGPPISIFLNPSGKDYRFSPGVNERLLKHYQEAVEVSQLCHEMLALLGGKAPHPHGIVPGGAAVGPRADILNKFASLLDRVRGFVETRLLPDTYLLAETYSDYFVIGRGPGNFMSYGGFPDGRGGYAFAPGVILKGERRLLDIGSIAEQIRHTWLRENEAPDPYKKGAYTWVEAPRYQGTPVEVGPLARAVIDGEDYKSSTMDRVVARSREAHKLVGLMFRWLDKIDMGKPAYRQPVGIANRHASGALEVPRGGLLHGVEVESDRISRYKIITPSEWNFSPRDDSGRLGVVEHCLMGIPVEDPDLPVEVGRVARSFDPCLYCATHVIKL